MHQAKIMIPHSVNIDYATIAVDSTQLIEIFPLMFICSFVLNEIEV